MEYELTFPENDFLVSSNYKLIPSHIEINKSKDPLTEAVTFLGTAYVAIKVQSILVLLLFTIFIIWKK